MPDPCAAAALEVLQRALCLEIDGEAFYREAAGRTPDATGRRMFLDLSEQEALHAEILRRQLDSLQASGCWAADERVTAPSCELTPSLFPQGAAHAAATGPRAGELQALWFALQKENESYELYRRGAHEATDPAAQGLYRYLAAAERGHFDMLMLNYEAIVNEGHRGPAD